MTMQKGSMVNTVEQQTKMSISGWKALPLVAIGWLASVAALVVGGIMVSAFGNNTMFWALSWMLIAVGGIMVVVMIPVSCGFFTLQPNEAKVLVLFGEYRGTVRQTGFFWANPFYARALSSVLPNDLNDEDGETKGKMHISPSKISLRARTLNGPKLKVNDKNGNPIEIATVIVWRIVDTAKAMFDVDNYEQYVSTQSETALRHVASLYAYDQREDSGEQAGGQIALRSNIGEVSTALKVELEERLEAAGITIDDARLTHLAYAPEIAHAMLRRQQAEAVIAAKTKIVQGAVSMVNMALKELEKDQVIDLDEERKASMVSNLMVVLCADNDAQPVINTGGLYS